ncbi:histone acetyltransferase type B catalytic subunit-like isoform X1 [Biomphalaria glabrata]|uniref:Histone acetyltransferase type B catalytic subunit n=2 Tax=Biomphalaria glabrata TaxID=6526 RepID=A0A9W3BQ54_BIOGL|nr:histone acetyltransferase type B catalytic subunit-like isoform X1 [Biomphalaria glabrata]
MADLSVAKKSDLESFKNNANDVIYFKLVRKEEDIEDESKTFHPDMTHQLFGDSELIFGYKNLNVHIYYTAARLIPYLNISYSESCHEDQHGIKPDDVEKSLSNELPPNYFTNLDTFRVALSEDVNFRPFGHMVDSYTLTPKNSEEKHFEVYYVKIEEPGFRDFHVKLQSFIKFYIDAASYIDVDDQQWDFFLVFEKYKENGEHKYATAGYMTVYNFYAYPSRIRPRISQVLILPPFQKMGLCARVLQTFYNICYNRPEVLDITVEDPSENFQRVRDFVDARNCCNLKSFQPSELNQGFSHEMTHEAQLKLKLNRLQARRMYEILRLKATDRGNKEHYRAYRLDVKRRLNIPFLRNRRTYKKLEKSLSDEELSQTLGLMKKEQKFQYLENAFQEELNSYQHVLDRLSTFQ